MIPSRFWYENVTKFAEKLDDIYVYIYIYIYNTSGRVVSDIQTSTILKIKAILAK